MNCLAATGIDTGPVFAVGVALLSAGVAIAAIAARRGRRNAAVFAVLPLALGLLLGGGLLSASPAEAAGGSCSTTSAPPPTPPCTPASAVADKVITGLEWTQSGSDFDTAADPAQVASIVADQHAIQTIDQLATFHETYDYDDPGTPASPDLAGATITSGLLNPGTGEIAFFPTSQFPPLSTQPISYAITLHQDWTYRDGCGGTLTTHQTFVGTYLAPGQPG